VANLMIIAGVLLLAYPLGTWAYTWWEQRQLREQLEQEHPSLAQTSFAGDFIPVATRATNAESNSATAADDAAAAAENAAAAAAQTQAETAFLAAIQERQAKQAEFKAAAEAFAGWLADKPGEPIGKILIPSIGVDVIMLEGANTRDLREGPGHWPGTALPSQDGNVVVAGHRVTHSRPFRHIDQMGPGDEVIFTIGSGRHTYTFVRNEIVPPTGMHIVQQTPAKTATIFACHPPGSARFRFVVHLSYVGSVTV
jgi:sortase A